MARPFSRGLGAWIGVVVLPQSESFVLVWGPEPTLGQHQTISSHARGATARKIYRDCSLHFVTKTTLSSPDRSGRAFSLTKRSLNTPTFWYKANDGLWWLGRIYSLTPDTAGLYPACFFNNPSPVKIPFTHICTPSVPQQEIDLGAFYHRRLAIFAKVFSATLV